MLTSMEEAVQLTVFGKNPGVQTPFFSTETLVIKCSVNSSFLITKTHHQFQGYRATYLDQEYKLSGFETSTVGLQNNLY